MDDDGEAVLLGWEHSHIKHEISRSTVDRRYLAPELTAVYPTETVEATDVFSLGLVFYTLTTSRRPFDAIQNEYNVAERMRSGQRPSRPESLGQLNREEGGRLWTLLEEMWAHSQSERPSSGEVVRRLKAIFG